MTIASVPRLPLLRLGEEYESLAASPLRDHRSGATLAELGLANPGLLRRDLRRLGAARGSLDALGARRRIEICREAARLFRGASLPLVEGGPEQSPEDYVRALSATSGLPHVLCRRNMDKVATVLEEMETILAGLTRGLPLELLDEGIGSAAGLELSYARSTDALGVVLPSNSPGVNSLWLPALALGVPVVLKPGRDEPWTPLRIARAFFAAGLPRGAIGYYPTDHEGAAVILEACGRSLLFGDESTTAAWASDPRVQLHGPGRSKVVVGPDVVDEWPRFLDVLVESVLAGGGRSCINASSIFVPRRADEIGAALAERLAAVGPTAPEDPAAELSAFANPRFAAFVDVAIESGLARGGARDLCAERRGSPRRAVSTERRGSPRRVEAHGATWLLPTVVRCDSVEHPLARTEYLFPFTSIVELPPERLLAELGPSLVVTVITRDGELARRALACRSIDRLNLGPVPTTRVEWDQPHEGNLFELLWERRAIQRAPW